MMIAMLVCVAGLALFVNVCRVKSQFWVRSYRQIVSGMVLPFVVALATDTWQMGIPELDILITR